MKPKGEISLGIFTHRKNSSENKLTLKLKKVNKEVGFV
jgi:hypothetical protein